MLRTFVERDFYGLLPDVDDHAILMQGVQLHIIRHKRGAIYLRPPVKARLEQYVHADTEVPRIGIRMEWPTLIPVMNAVRTMLENKICPPGTIENTEQVLAKLSSAGNEYIDDFLDLALEPHLADVVDHEFFDVRVD